MQQYSAEAAVIGINTSLDKVKGDIVTQTLDKLNSPGSIGKSKNSASGMGSMSDTYNFSKSVLSAVYEGKGTIIDYSR